MNKDLELEELIGNIDTEALLNSPKSKGLDLVKELEPVYDIPVKVSAVLGKTKIKISDLLKINKGSVLELDKKIGENIDIYVNDNLVAKGEVIVVDGKVGITMTEIIKPVLK